MKTETVLFDTVAPHPNPVNLADLLTEIEGVIKKHVILNDHAAAALAVWVLHTYTLELRDTVAYVAIESPEKRCGKTTLLSVLAAMAHRPLISSNITVGALFRAIHNCSPTLFIDEADTFLAGNSIMRGIINSGNTRRTAYVLRLSSSKSATLPSPPSGERDGVRGQLAENSNADQTMAGGAATGIKKYSCWCPKVIAIIGEAPDTIADRSIVVKMARKLTTETCLPLAALNTTGIRAKCARFALDTRDSIAQCHKISGEGLNDRAADTFDPLYVIAHHAGGVWLQKLHTAALALSATADSNAGAGLILDILDILVESGREKIFTRDLLAELRDGGMRSNALKNSDINEYQISKMLRPYGIRPTTIRIGINVSTGYVRADFREARNRYISSTDIDARVEGIDRRMRLRMEAGFEAQKQLSIMSQSPSNPSQNQFRADAVKLLRELERNPFRNNENRNPLQGEDPLNANVAT